MKLTNVHGFPTIDAYIKYKLAIYEQKEKSFETLFELMFDERDNVMVETTDGYRIHRITYGAFRDRILAAIPAVAEALREVPVGEMVGLYMGNRPEWLMAFWALLGAGYRPLLLNTRLPDTVLETVLTEHHVKAVLTDDHTFAAAATVRWDDLPDGVGEMPARPFGTEVLFMSSGTTGHVKLCGYTGENFYYQILDSANIIAACPAIKRHYEGELKHLVLLPLCHVFGFIAVYLWFGFFARTFVFPRDLDPATIQRTVKKHKVTHIFAVPMVWEAVHRAAKTKIRSRGDKTYQKFVKVTAWVNRLDGCGGDLLARKVLKEVRDGLFGDSICFLISGGSHIDPSTLRFFNDIGYHMANGYGMTEIGITSVERAGKKKLLNLGSIGAPFGYTEYTVSEEGHLLVRGKTRASRILADGKEMVTQDAAWFDTGDMMAHRDGRYYALGRTDDLIVCEDGENLNPTLAEQALAVPGIDKLCVFLTTDKTAAVIASVPGCFDADRILELASALSDKMAAAKLDRAIRTVYFTRDSLLSPGDFKLSRTKVACRVADGSLTTFSPADVKEGHQVVFAGLEQDLAALFAEVLGKDVAEIGRDSHFFRDLGGTSMDYYALMGLVRDRLGARVDTGDAAGPVTVAEFHDYLTK